MVTSKDQPSTTHTRRTERLPSHPPVDSCFSRPTPPPLEPLQPASRTATPVAVPMSPPVNASLTKPKLDSVPPPAVGPRRTKPCPATLPPPPIGAQPHEPRLVPAREPTLGEIVVQMPLEPSHNRKPWLRLGGTLGMAASLLFAVGIASSTTSAPSADRAPAPQEVRTTTGLRASFATLVSAWVNLGIPAAAVQPEPSPAEIRGELPNDDLLVVAALDPTAASNPNAVTVPRLELAPQPRRSRRPRHRPQASLAAAEAEATPPPVPATERSSSRRRRPLSAAALLHDGEVALVLGDAERAYQLATRSRDTDPREDASSLVARSACLIGKRDEAKQALRDLPLFERGAVRRDCRRSGARIGL
jgi:hypothetical protein